MTMLGMQADMQCHYFPSYFLTRDVNLNASCSIWPSSNADKILMNGHYYNSNLTPPFPDQYLAYKDKFKQTMLQHEAIFKSQVHELHRLYNRQRELMVEMKRIEFGGQRLQLENSTSNQIFSETSFQYKKTCIVPAIPWLNHTHGQSSVPFAENKQSHVPCVQGNMMLAGSSIVQTEGHRKESELLESNCKKIGKKILDLELPAYAYIDSEPEESLAEEINPSEMLSYSRKSFVENLQKNDVEPCRATDDASFSLRTKCFADLNEPIKFEEESDSEYSGFLHPVPGHVEIQHQDLPWIGNSQLQFEAQVIQNTKTREDPQYSPEVILLDKNEDQQECIYDIDNDEADDDQDTKRVCEISPSHMLDMNNGNLVTKSEYECGSSSVSSFRERTRNLVRTPIVQALPCLKRSVPSLSGISKQRSHQYAGDNSCPAINLESEPDYSNKKRIKSSMGLVLARDIDLNSISPCYAPDVDADSFCLADLEKNFKGLTHDDESSKKLDSDCNSMPDLGEQINVIDLDSVRNCKPDKKSSGSKFNVDLNTFIDEDDSLPLPSSSTEDDSLPLPSPPTEDDSLPLPSPSTEVDLHAPESPENKERSPPRGDLEENQLDIPCELSMLENGEPVEDLVTMAERSPPRGDSDENQLDISCEVSMLENGKPEEDLVTMAERSPPRGDSEENQLDIPCELSMLENGDPVEDLVTMAERSPPRGNSDENQLDISCELSMLENGKPEEYFVTMAERSPPIGDLDENQLDIPSEMSMSENGKPEEDLVTMAERSPPRADSEENQLDVPSELSMLENGKPEEDLATMAAEAIVSISSSEAQNHSDSATPGPSKGPKSDFLFWFAKLASSVEDDPESEFGVVLCCKNLDRHKKHSRDEIDYFEAMTLQLEETKPEEYCCKSSTQKEAACPASVPRRGRIRRARQQRKDFQSEILPSLASLSRYEVTEDLQAIGGLIEAAHCSSGETRTGRNGLRRGRRGRPSLSSKVETETPPCVALDKQSRHTECSMEEKNLIDWGKITRRRRGQRCPANNPRLIASQV